MTAIEIVRAWVAAVNARDVELALGLTAADFEVRGPRGSRRGHLALREWIEGTPVDMTTLRTFAGPDAVVLLQRVIWRDANGFAIGEGTVANRFIVAGERVVTLARHDRLDDALREAGLDEASEMHDEVRPRGQDAPAARDTAAPGHVALLGDSILDNGAYTGGAPDVTTHLRSLLPAGWQVTLCAEDGATTAAVARQVARVPPGISHIVLAVGGNDALQSFDLLAQRVTSVADALARIDRRLATFERDYRAALDAVAAAARPVIVCTIYNGALDASQADAARLGLTLFNDVILRAAIDRGADVVELRAICTSPDDYANPIEPSGTGGRKIAAAIARALSGEERPGTRAWGA